MTFNVYTSGGQDSKIDSRVAHPKKSNDEAIRPPEQTPHYEWKWCVVGGTEHVTFDLIQAH
jgi:hypothetical protein